MERVRKTFFDPLATSKAQIRDILEELPVGTAHPFSPEKTLLCRTDAGIDEIDISSYPEDFFFNAVDLGEMGEILLRRMAGFTRNLSVFDDFHIMQAPASTFKIPLVSNQITILAVSERTPTYYDFCFADADCNTCCWTARSTFPGITHSGDLLNGKDLLDHVRINPETLTEKEICVFISGYTCTQITRFLGTHPALMVADHVEKILYIVPVPLDAATIGDATICCPLVIKRDGGSLICSILPAATTDRGMMCSTAKLTSPAFPEAIKRANFTVSDRPTVMPKAITDGSAMKVDPSISAENISKMLAKEKAVITTSGIILPPSLDLKETQHIRFGTGLEFKLPDEELPTKEQPSAVVLPCVFGSQIQGPVLLATGTVPANIPFPNENALREYYSKLKNIIVIVDERMMDNARNLATSHRLNALFIVQLKPENDPKNSDEVLKLMNSANVNAVTALAGPQSLVLVQIFDKYYFYRGIADQTHLKTIGLAFGSDVTSVVESVGMESLINPGAERIVDISDPIPILLPVSGQLVKPQDLEKLFEGLPIEKLNGMVKDIEGAIPQLQVLLNQKDLSALSKTLIASLSKKVNDAVAPLRTAYTQYLTKEYKISDPESVKKKNLMLGDLRKTTKEMQKVLEPVISAFANMMSAQTTSKRTHDLKRLVRQAQIQGNVEAVKTMTFDNLAGYLETYATDMGVMLLNIETGGFNKLLGNLKNEAIDASECCDLDSRVLHLEGFDAGIIIPQSQNQHGGPLRSQNGPNHPIMALPYLSQSMGTGSMLAWVCWDEFVNLESPYTVRWMEKCNDAHIAALRIIMRDTLSNAVASREHNIHPGSVETGYLMAALLMAAMSKLAGMRTSAPVVLDKAEDTVTRLMRGLFGNLLTIAGSGVRPLSMVWQLFGTHPQYDVPTNGPEWIWYETVVALYPYTGWPLEKFYHNLERLLDKAIVRVVTKGEDTGQIKASSSAKLLSHGKLRNVQLQHSRTIITTVMRMLTDDGADIQAIAKRLLEKIPSKLESQTNSYTMMITYLEHLAAGGERRQQDDLVNASVYNKRSAAYSPLKTKVWEACEKKDWVAAKEHCQALIDENARLATFWKLKKPEQLKVQNFQAYKSLLEADFGENIDQATKNKNEKLGNKVRNDAERNRIPWQVGKEGEFGDNIEPLDEVFMHKILTGGTLEVSEAVPAEVEQPEAEAEAEAKTETTVAAPPKPEDEFLEFKGSLQASFITTMQKDLSANDVCNILRIPPSAMRVFIKALNPDFVWEDLASNFKGVILDLLKDRSGRAESCPVKKLLDLGQREGKLLMEV